MSMMMTALLCFTWLEEGQGIVICKKFLFGCSKRFREYVRERKSRLQKLCRRRKRCTFIEWESISWVAISCGKTSLQRKTMSFKQGVFAKKYPFFTMITSQCSIPSKRLILTLFSAFENLRLLKMIKN